MSEEILRKIQNNRIEEIKSLLVMALANATDEEKCSDLENDMYADMQNLKESISYYLESEEL